MPRNISRLIFVALAIFLSCCLGDVEYTTFQLSTPRIGFSAIEAGSKAYFVGGFEGGDLKATSTVEVYDLDAQNKSSPIFLKSPRAYVVPLVIEPHIYFVGGIEYVNPPLFYDPDQRQLVSYGIGPTVVTPRALYIGDMYLTIAGISGVDIFDVQNKTWIDTAPLTDLLSHLGNYSIVSNRNVVIVIGGVNFTTGEDTRTIWVYDIVTGSLRDYPGLLATFIGVTSKESNGVIAISLNYNTVLAYHLEREEWRLCEFSNLKDLFVLQNETFLFNSTGLTTINWNITEEPSHQNFGNELRHAFMLNNEVFYIRDGAGPASYIYKYYNDRALWGIVQTLPVVGSIGLSVSLQNWHVVVSNAQEVFGYNYDAGLWYQVADLGGLYFSPIASLVPAEDPDTVYIFEGNKRMTKTIFTDQGTTNPIKQVPCAIVPQLRFGSDFVEVATGYIMSMSNLTESTPLDLTAYATYFSAYSSNRLVYMPSMMNKETARAPYHHIDVYNYVTEEWTNSTIDMPEELIAAYTTSSLNYLFSAAVLGSKIIVWLNTAVGVYDPLTGSWTMHANYSMDSINNVEASSIDVPVPVAQGSAFMRTNANFFDIFSPEDFDTRRQTSKAPAVEESKEYVFRQCLARDSKIYVASKTGGGIAQDRYNTLYVYDVPGNTWVYEQVPFALSASQVPTIALAGDYLLSLQPNGFLSYWDITNSIWYDQQLDIQFSPAVVLETSANITFIGGGIDSLTNRWTDAMMVIPHSAISPTKGPVADNSSTTPESLGFLTESELVAAIVVPIGAVLIGAALLVILLVRRQRRRRRQEGSTIGLAGKYGQWFIPYENIKFGSMIGQGASGQVFKGTWNNTTVALKVSMTQANSTVISELELMIQLRPHPNVIQLFGFSVHPETDSIILVIEFCNGGSLDDTLFDEKRQISMQQKVAWLIGIAKGLEHLHANNIVHRDIAARNVLLHQNEPKITDFGMSRLIEEDKQHGTTKSELGPIRWMSPESLRNKEYSSRSDIWSYGILMYEVIAQEEPHAEADPIEIGRLIRDDTLTPTIPPSCPTSLAQIMQECWHASPDKRITIDKIVTQLEALQNVH